MATIDEYIESITFKSQVSDNSNKQQAEKDKIFKMVRNRIYMYFFSMKTQDIYLQVLDYHFTSILIII